jgi:murein L,D-transpeptidase YcbB/YkuD
MAAKQIDRKLNQFYHERDMKPLWVAADGPTGKAGILLTVFVAADTQGLNPNDYYVGQIKRYWDKKDAETLARLELLLTLALGDYAADLVEGRRQPRQIDPDLFATARDNEIDSATLVEQAVAAPDLTAFLEELAPPFLQYRGLRDKLATFRAMAARGGWSQVRLGPVLKPGLKDPRVPDIRRRLSATGECPEDDPTESTEYDERLVLAVKKFQQHNGLEPDGVLGSATIAAMNVPVAKRINQIIVNMETWRWVARNPGDWLLLVNIPSFELWGVRNNKVEIALPVIVGREYTMTPVFSDKLRYVEFNPYWDVPQSIAQKEMLPELQKDPGYLQTQHLRLFEGEGAGRHEINSAAVDWTRVTPEEMDRYHLRQDPGPDNSLGTVKFVFPNQFDVYLHDTPARELFERTKRAFSHGCIRVARAQDLAVYVLGGPAKGWDEERVRSIIAGGKNQVVHLDSPLPIYIFYHTAVVDPESHELYFYEDVYGRDAILEKALL